MNTDDLNKLQVYALIMAHQAAEKNYATESVMAERLSLDPSFVRSVVNKGIAQGELDERGDRRFLLTVTGRQQLTSLIHNY
jgi:hypothetical protein